MTAPWFSDSSKGIVLIVDTTCSVAPSACYAAGALALSTHVSLPPSDYLITVNITGSITPAARELSCTAKEAFAFRARSTHGILLSELAALVLRPVSGQWII